MRYIVIALLVALCVGCATTTQPTIPPALETAYGHVLVLLGHVRANEWASVPGDLLDLQADARTLGAKYEGIKPALDTLIADIKAKEDGLTILFDALDLASDIRAALNDPTKAAAIEKKLGVAP